MKLRVRESVRKQEREREREPGRNAKLCVCKIQQPLFSAAFILSLIFSNSNPLSPPLFLVSFQYFCSMLPPFFLHRIVMPAVLLLVVRTAHCMTTTTAAAMAMATTTKAK